MKSVIQGIAILALVAGVSGEGLAQSPPVATVAGADTVGLSLEEALRSATSRSDEVRLARSQVDVADAQISSVRAQALPQVNANLGYTRTFRSAFSGGGGITLPDSMQFSPDPSMPLEDRVRYLEDKAPMAGMGGLGQLFGNLPFGQKNAYTAGVGVTQTLYSGGRVGAALDIASSYREAARHQLSEQVSEIEFQVKSAYYRALFAQELEGAAKEALDQAERFLDQEKLREKAGRASELDVLRAEVARENLRPRLVEAQNAADLSRLNLLRLVGLPLNQPVRLTSDLDTPEQGADPVVDPSMLAKRPALEAAKGAVDMREGQVRVAKGSFLPSVGFQMNYGRMIYPTDAFKLQGDWRTDWSASVGVQIPIFSGFQRKAELEQARVELEQAQLQLSQATKAVQLEYEQARGERERTRLEIDARHRTVEQAERVHNLTTLRYERGLATQIDVSDARLALLQARTNLAQALSDYHIADARLVRALGGSKALSRPAPRGRGEQDGPAQGAGEGAGRDGQGAGQR